MKSLKSEQAGRLPSVNQNFERLARAGREVDVVRLGIERNGPRAAHGLERLHDGEFVGRIFVRNRDGAVAVGTERQLRPRIKRVFRTCRPWMKISIELQNKTFGGSTDRASNAPSHDCARVPGCLERAVHEERNNLFTCLSLA